MKRWLTGIAGALLLAGLAIQLVPVERTNPATAAVIQPPADVERLLRRACWNCHSNQTDWPWYSHVAPASWLLERHVREGRDDMNFTEWPADDPEETTELIEEIGEQLEADAMPPRSYRLVHPEARLTEAERRLLIDWSLAAGGFDRLEERLMESAGGS